MSGEESRQSRRYKVCVFSFTLLQCIVTERTVLIGCLVVDYVTSRSVFGREHDIYHSVNILPLSSSIKLCYKEMDILY